MGLTLAEKVMSRLAGRQVSAGEFVEIQPDWTFSLDDGIGLVDRYFRQQGVEKLAAPERIAIFYDHYSPADTPLHAHVQRIGRLLAQRFGIKRLYDVGEGISHQIAVETGLIHPGHMVTNTDSHTCTVGAVGAVGCGIGAAEMAFLWAHGSLWFRVPESVRLVLTGKLAAGASAKDVVLTILGRISARGAIYASVEYHGDGLSQFSISDRMTLCNMGIEMGAKFASVPADAVTRAHYDSLGIDIAAAVLPDSDATYGAEHVIDLASIEPMVSVPNRVDDVHCISALPDIKINQAFLGTCTNGRYEDLFEAAAILKGKQLAPGVRMLVTPASRRVFQKALADGLIATFIEAGCTVTTPGCGACAGIHQGVLAEEEVCISSSSRNFLGRMGHRDARIYLGSPATVAASAIAGRLTDPRPSLPIGQVARVLN
jgi:homoaconitate hydratase family protein